MKDNASWYQFKPMIAVYLDLNPVDVMPYSTWEDLGVDSLDFVELIMMIEEGYDVEFEEREVEDIKSIGGLHVLLMRTLESKREVDITHRDTLNTRGSAGYGRAARLRSVLENLVEGSSPVFNHKSDGVKVKSGQSWVPTALIDEAEAALIGEK